MKHMKFIKPVLTLAFAGALVCALTACGQGNSEPVAATVNGETIPEQKVTDTIQNIRNQSGLMEDDAWGNWLATNGFTPESVREQIIDSLVQEKLFTFAAKDEGVTVDESVVDDYVDQMKNHYETDDAWKQALASAGFTPEEYRTTIENQLMRQELTKKVTESVVGNDEDYLEAAKSYAPFFDGAKRSSHILFDSEDTETATQVLNELNEGSITFEEAAEQYSVDPGSAANGGDVGWDKMSNFVPQYTDALANLTPGQISGLVDSDFGIHIIKCTDEFTMPEELTSLDQLPVELADSIRSMVDDSLKKTSFQEFMDDYKSKAEIVINEMPKDVPYNVTLPEVEDTSEVDSDETPAEVEQPASEEAVDGEAASEAKSE